VALDRLDAAGEMTLFVLAAAALIPLSWLIGEVTDNVALHVGPGIGGFLNATFGNAPELIIAIIAVSEGLSAIVRATLVGSIAGNLLLVLASRFSWAEPAQSIASLPAPRWPWSDSLRSSRCSWPCRASTAIRIAAH
jgi:hypothetical protein